MESKITLLAQIFKLIPDELVSALSKKYVKPSNARSFCPKAHLFSLLLCHLGQADSLRDISVALGSISTDLEKLGIHKIPTKSTLSYNNRNFNWEFFKDVYLGLYNRFYPNRVLDGFSEQVFALDSTTISLCVNTFDWAHFRSTKGGIKLHTLLELKNCLPAFIHMTNANRHDAPEMTNFEIPARSWVVMDRGYVDYGRLKVINDGKINFVVRSKDNLKFDIVSSKETTSPEVISDQIVTPTRTASSSQYNANLRLVKVKDLENGLELELLTNNTEVSASQIGQLYKSRWKVETFFKCIKQNLTIKTFIGTNDNAVMCQVWSAMIAVLLTKYIKETAKEDRPFSNLINYIRMHLMTRASLYKCLKWPWNVKTINEDLLPNNEPDLFNSR
jgi:hypothetical protein